VSQDNNMDKKNDVLLIELYISIRLSFTCKTAPHMPITYVIIVPINKIIQK
jgi:hypothetical protein